MVSMETGRNNWNLLGQVAGYKENGGTAVGRFTDHLSGLDFQPRRLMTERKWRNQRSFIGGRSTGICLCRDPEITKSLECNHRGF